VSKFFIRVYIEKGLNRKARFWTGLLLVVLAYTLPFAGFAAVKAYLNLMLTVAAFMFTVYLVHRVTIRDVRPKYPIVSPEGHPDVYTGRMPRPIYEDMQRYPEFFKKKRRKKLDEKKIKRNTSS